MSAPRPLFEKTLMLLNRRCIHLVISVKTRDFTMFLMKLSRLQICANLSLLFNYSIM